MISSTHRAAFTAEDARRNEEVQRLAREGRVDGLIDRLDDPSWPVRREVVAALAASGNAAVAPLCHALAHRRDSEGRIAATVDALSALVGDADAALSALATAADVEAPVLADIAQILGRRRTSVAVGAVVALSRHHDDNVAVSAIEALGRIGGRAAIDSLIEAVLSGNFFRAFPAIDVLGRSGDPRAIAPLTTLLQQPMYAAEAARALGRTGDATAARPLLALIPKSPHATLIRVAAVALAELHERHRDRFGTEQVVDAELQGQLDRSALVRQLLRALAEGDSAERAAICFLLGVLGDPSAAPALTALLEGPEPVMEAATAALRTLGPRIEDDILAGIRSGTSTQRRALLPFAFSRAGAADVVGCLTDDDPDVRVLACDALARIGDVKVVSALFPLLADADPRVTYAAIAAIQSLGSGETERLTVAAATSPDVRVRRAALRILAYFGAPATIEIFLTALTDSDERVREGAVQGLPMMDDPRAFDALVAAARDPLGRTRAAAMRSLGHCVGDLRANAHLLKGLQDADPWVRYYACQALGKQEFEPAVEAIIRVLDDPAGQVRVAAVEALSCLKSETATKALEAAASNPDGDIRRAALLGLGVAKRTQALPLILEAARTADPATRLVALSALASFRTPETMEALAAAAIDGEDGMRTAAVGFLAAMAGPAATRTLIGLLRVTLYPEPVVAALSLYVEGRVAALRAALESADEQTAPAIVSALTRLRRIDATAALVAAMGMPNIAARKAAASALAASADKDAVAILRRAAQDDPVLEVRQICALLISR